jgi:aspartate/methionine/tyrosine aminotransferase
LEFIASLCRQHDVLCITDEIYEHILYDGAEHVPMMTLPGMREQCVLINSMSKTYSVTGWRVGWVLAAPDLTESIRKVHDFLTVGAAHPLQQAGVHALASEASYYRELSEHYRARRDMLLEILREAGFRPFAPKGAYYVMADISAFGFPDDVEFARYLVEEIGVAAVPGSSFFDAASANRGIGEASKGHRTGIDFSSSRQLIRFCFCKKYETLEEARSRLIHLRIQ